MLSSPAAIIVLGGVLLGSLFILWQAFGPAPRRRRGLRRAQRRLGEGAWADALERVHKLRKRGSPSLVWQKRFNVLEAECLQGAAASLLQEKKFEEALSQLARAADLLERSDLEARLRVQAAMLEEVRRMFALGKDQSAALHDLIASILLIHSPCREASFWQGLTFLRGGDREKAIDALQAARGAGRALILDESLGDLSATDTAATAFIDPPLYLGAILLSGGQAKDALRYLTEANRIDANCPLVTVQLGGALIAAGGDTQLAVRALQRALGPSGLSQWDGDPRHGWVKAFPEDRSYVRKLASAHSYICPLWGGDFGLLLRQGRLALAQGYYKLSRFQEAAELFGAAIKEGAPSLEVVRGLGLALARLGQYDEAFKHLRSAHEMEEPKDRLTAGYLALCGARGTPTRQEDKARNIAWAIGVVSQFTAPGDKEWVALINALFAEARAENLTLSLDDQLYLCEHLWSVHETDPAAAQAFHHLASTYPKAVRPEYAWLYCRSAQQHHVGGEHALDLFAMTFSHREAAQEFFAQCRWEFVELEFAFLERAAALAPGRFPEVLGPDYAGRGESLLLSRSTVQEKAGQLDDALTSAKILAKLAPDNSKALDRLASLHYRVGQPDEAVAALETWHDAHPDDPLPLARLAILLQQRGLLSECQSKLREAMALSDPSVRSRLAFLGARLTLQALFAKAQPADPLDKDGLAIVTRFLDDCLQTNPDHQDAPWLLAAVHWLRGGRAGLALSVAALDKADIDNPRNQFFAALCRWAARDFLGAVEISRRLALPGPTERLLKDDDGPPVSDAPSVDWSVENAYLCGLAHLAMGSSEAAAGALKSPALTRHSPSARHAQALLGLIGFTTGDLEAATKWWQTLDPKDRAAWKLVEPLAGAVFVSAVDAFRREEFEEAAEKLRAAGKLGHRDRRLGNLLVLSLFKAGQAAVYG